MATHPIIAEDIRGAIRRSFLWHDYHS